MVKTAVTVALSILFSFHLYAQDPLEIIKRADEKMRGLSSQGEMSMKIVRPDWSREIVMKSWSKGTDYSMILITAPSRDKGSAFLNRDKEMWNWQPSIERVIKLPPSMMMQSWMGSDFTNDDLVKQSSIVTDYTHKLLKDTTVEGRECYQIELIPKPDAPVVWGKIISCISKKDELQLLTRFYDEDLFLVNTMLGKEVKEMGGRTLPSVLEMIPADNPRQKTIIRYISLEFDVDIDDQFFSIQNMKRLR